MTFPSIRSHSKITIEKNVSNKELVQNLCIVYTKLKENLKKLYSKILRLEKEPQTGETALN